MSDEVLSTMHAGVRVIICGSPEQLISLETEEDIDHCPAFTRSISVCPLSILQFAAAGIPHDHIKVEMTIAYACGLSL